MNHLLHREAPPCNLGQTYSQAYAMTVAGELTVSEHDVCHGTAAWHMMEAILKDDTCAVRAACVSLTRASSAMASSARCAALACPACSASTSLSAAACRFLACWCSRCSADSSDCLFSASAPAVCTSHVRNFAHQLMCYKSLMTSAPLSYTRTSSTEEFTESRWMNCTGCPVSGVLKIPPALFTLMTQRDCQPGVVT